jgi:hypothetical protein
MSWQPIETFDKKANAYTSVLTRGPQGVLVASWWVPLDKHMPSAWIAEGPWGASRIAPEFWAPIPEFKQEDPK